MEMAVVLNNTHYCLLTVVEIRVPANAHNHLIYTTS